MIPVRFRVLGTPIPQGSMKAFAIRKGGRLTGGTVVTSGRDGPVRPWRQSIIDQVRDLNLRDREAGPVRVFIEFTLDRPKSHYGTGRNAGRVKDSAPAYPAVKPDIDKLTRAVLDALTEAGMWMDDAQVVDLQVTKRYTVAGFPPGAGIAVCDA